MWLSELLALNEVSLDASTIQLLQDVDQSLERVQSLGDFSPELKERITREFLPDRISDTLIIESIYVNARLTRAVLEGQALADGDQYGQRAIEAVNEATMLMEHEAKNGRPMTIQLVREINRRIVQDSGEVSSPGAFRESDVTITGATIQPPNWTVLLETMQDFVKQVEDAQTHPLVVAAWAHWIIARLHPFENGNGRTARIIQDFFLIRGALIPVGIPAGKRSDYYDALAWADVELDMGPLVSIIADAEMYALEKMFNLAREEQITRERVATLAREAQKTNAQRRENEYQVWVRRMELVADELERILRTFNDYANTGIVFRIDRYEVKSQEMWQEIRERGWAKNTWFIRVTVHNQGRHQLSILFYFRLHRPNWIAERTSEMMKSVALFLDVRDADEQFKIGDRLDDPFISLREIVVDPHGYWVFEPVTAADRTVVPGVTYQGDSIYWTGRFVDHLAGEFTTFLEQVLDRIGTR